MKKHEKVLAALFSSCICIFAVVFLFKRIIMHTGLDYHFFDTPTRVICFAFALSLLGMIALLVNCWLRARREAGKKAISKLYTLSFLLSFIPFLLLLIAAADSWKNGFTFLSTCYGSEAFIDTIVFWGGIYFGIMIPVFPLLIFWQILYIWKWAAERKRIRKIH